MRIIITPLGEELVKTMKEDMEVLNKTRVAFANRKENKHHMNKTDGNATDRVETHYSNKAIFTFR